MQPVGNSQGAQPISPRAHRRTEKARANKVLSSVPEHPSPPPQKESQRPESAWSDLDTMHGVEVPLAYRAPAPTPASTPDPQIPGARTPVGQPPLLPAPSQRRQFVVDYGAQAQQPAPVLSAPVQSRHDPRHFYLPPVRERPISAPLQPRVFDIRVGIERDPQRTNPTFEVHVRFNFAMQPGDLR